MESAQIPQPAPEFSLKAIYTEREISPASCQGQPLLLLFHNHLTLRAVRPFQEKVRAKYLSPTAPMICSIADLSSAPRFAHGMARRAMAAGYQEAVSLLPAGLDPADYVIILPDWSGAVTRAFGIQKVGKAAAVVLLDAEWHIVDRYQGRDPGKAALKMLAEHGIGAEMD